MARYAERTVVTEDRSRQEIERTLKRYGADQFIYGWETERAVLAFRVRGRQIRYQLQMPALEGFRLTDRRNVRSETSQQAAWQQACRQRWRALALIIKAKLEGVEAGITTFEAEFLAQTLLPNGQAVGEWLQPQLNRVYELGEMPESLLLLSAPDKSRR